MLSATAAGPMLHWPLPSRESVAVGRVNVGPAPQMSSAGLRRGHAERRVEVAQPEGAVLAREQRDGWLMMGAIVRVMRFQSSVPVERDHRLHVEDVDRRILAGAEVKVILQRYADQVGYWVLPFFANSDALSSAAHSRAVIKA